MTPGLIDTHSHLQADALAADLPRLVDEARKAGVEDILICAGQRNDWERCAELAHAYDLSYLLGIHPLCVQRATSDDLPALEAAARAALADPHFVGIGEIGLEGPDTVEGDVQEVFFEAQLRIARSLALPVSLHVRRSASRVLRYLRRHPVMGAVHAFNGSDAERTAFLSLGLVLGFGGALTYEGSRRIRRHCAEVPANAWVLETDAPDMPSSARRDAGDLRTAPADIVETLQLAAALRGITTETAQNQSRANALRSFPRLYLRHQG